MPIVPSLGILAILRLRKIPTFYYCNFSTTITAQSLLTKNVNTLFNKEICKNAIQSGNFSYTKYGQDLWRRHYFAFWSVMASNIEANKVKKLTQILTRKINIIFLGKTLWLSHMRAGSTVPYLTLSKSIHFYKRHWYSQRTLKRAIQFTRDMVIKDKIY